MQDTKRRSVVFWQGIARAREDLPGLLSLLLFLTATAILFRSWEFALLVTASLGFHELGHALVLAWYRLEFRISFGIVGAYTWSRVEDRAALSQFGNSAIHLAGPIFSLLLALVALTINALWQPDSRHLLVLANFSAQVGFLNLLPLGELTDGGKTLRRIVLSVGQKPWARLIIVLLSAISVLIPLRMIGMEAWQQSLAQLSAMGVGLVLIGVWLAASLLIELRRGEWRERSPRKPMNLQKVIFLALVMWDLLAALLLVILATPFWLQPDYVLGTLQNIDRLVNWLVNLF